MLYLLTSQLIGEENMLHIGIPRIVAGESTSRLCCDVTIANERISLWYEVDNRFAPFLCIERVDAFLLPLLPMAFATGQDIHCDGEISARLYYQLTQYYIPAVCRNCEKKKAFTIHGVANGNPLPNAGAVISGFSGGVDSMYTVMSHTNDHIPSSYRLTHVGVFNSGAYAQQAETPRHFSRARKKAALFAAETGLEALWVNSNIERILRESYLNNFVYRNVGCALALQKLFSTYLHASSVDFASFSFAGDKLTRYEFLAVHCFSTENMAVYCSGGELTRLEKVRQLYTYPASYKWLHPCVMGILGDMNCGTCLKCLAWHVMLYADDKMNLYDKIIDVPAFLEDLPARTAEVWIRRKQMLSLTYAAQLLQEKGLQPKQFMVHKWHADILRRALAKKKGI